MTQLNFDADRHTDYAADVRAMARDDFDDFDDRLDFGDALNRRGLDARMTEAVDQLGEDEAAEIYETEFDQLTEEVCDD